MGYVDDLRKIEVKGRFIDEIHPARDISVAPDLVISVHTLEHVDDPLSGLRPIFEFAADDAYFVIEVPGFDSLVNACRFDQVFHQHLNYFSLASVKAMIEQLGGEYIAHQFNYGYWQGTMLIAFKKPSKASRLTDNQRQAPTADVITRQYRSFKTQLQEVERSMIHFTSQNIPIYGLGAAQMFPSLAYHFQSRLDFLECVFDDNLEKNQLMWPGFATPIRAPLDHRAIQNGAVLITALDSSRPLLQKLFAANARHIFYPLNML